MELPAGDEDDGTFLSELLALLDDADDEVPPLDVTAAAVASVAPQRRPEPPKRRTPTVSGATRLKRSLDVLRVEAAQLTEQLVRLRDAHGDGHSVERQRALTERRKRQRAQDECQQLREAMYTQTQFIRGMRSMFSATPRFASTLDLCRYLHRHTRLPRERKSRWGEYAAEAHDAQMHAAMDVLCRETESLALTDTTSEATEKTARVHGELIEDTGSRSTTSMAVYTVDTTDIHAVVRAVCVAVRDVVTICPHGHPLRVSRDIIDVEGSPMSNTLYRVMQIHHCNPESGEELTVESHVITSYKVTDDYALVLWDFVDVDELHPTPETTNITREITGVCMIRREWSDEHGAERTVVRSIKTKKFRLHDEIISNRLQHFVCMSHPVSLAQWNELLFRRLVLDQVAAEAAAYSRVTNG